LLNNLEDNREVTNGSAEDKFRVIKYWRSNQE